MFLSTPHRGSIHARALNGLLSFALGFSQKSYVAQLDTGSETLDDINDHFRTICEGLHIISLYETLPVSFGAGIKRIIVGKGSGILGYPTEFSAPLIADHHSICKFPNRQDANYKMVFELVRKLIEQLQLTLADSCLGIDGEVNHSRLLGIIDFSDDHFRVNLNEGEPELCDWFFDRESFTQWLEDEKRCKILWITGLPGSGKSVLASMAIDYLQKKYSAQNCQYYFFTAFQPENNNPAYFARALLLQLMLSHPKVEEAIMQLNNQTGLDFKSETFEHLWNFVFCRLFTIEFEGPLYWVIDGIEGQELSVPLLDVFAKMQPGKVTIKVLIFSRVNAPLRSGCNPVINDRISVTETAKNIRTFVQKMIPLSTATEQIVTGAEGSFLWAGLAVELLLGRESPEVGLTDMMLESIFRDMVPKYNFMLARLKAMPKDCQDLAIRVLSWATLSARPLKLVELEEAIEYELEGRGPVKENATRLEEAIEYDLEGRGPVKENVTEVCGHFIRIEKGIVSLVHSNVREYLLTRPYEPHPFLDFQVAHEYQATICLRYLCNDKWQDTPFTTSWNRAKKEEKQVSLGKSHHFLDYAWVNWVFHVSNCKKNSPKLLRLLERFFSKFILSWIGAAAYSSNLRVVIDGMKSLEDYVNKSRLVVPIRKTSTAEEFPEEGFHFLERCIHDVRRLVAKFGPSLVRHPFIIDTRLRPLLPRGSPLYSPNKPGSISLTVKGRIQERFDESFAQLTIEEEEFISRVICFGEYFLTLLPRKGTIIIWHAETFDEFQRFSHHEPVNLVSVDATGALAVSAGDVTIRIWDILTGAQVSCFAKEPFATVVDLGFEGDETVYFIYDYCAILTYNFRDKSVTSNHILRTGKKVKNHASLKAIEMNVRTKEIAAAFNDGTIIVWAPQEGIYRQRSLHVPGQESKEQIDAPEILRWRPGSDAILFSDLEELYILHLDTTIVRWGLGMCYNVLYRNTGAREMVFNTAGTLLLTSDSFGTLNVWAMPDFELVYRLQREEFVRDLAFSPDDQRIYGVRDSNCFVWYPNELIQFSKRDSVKELMPSGFNRGIVDITSPRTRVPHITCLACDRFNKFFCCGRDNASVDDSARVILKRLGVKEDGSWVTKTVLNIRITEMAEQLTFDPDEDYLLVSTETNDRVWDLKSKKERYRVNRGSRSVTKWVQHPSNKKHLLRIDSAGLHIHEWPTLRHLVTKSTPFTERYSFQEGVDITKGRSRISRWFIDGLAEDQLSLQSLTVSINKLYIVYELPDELTREIMNSDKQKPSFGVIHTSGLGSAEKGPFAHRLLTDSTGVVKRFLGFFYDRIVFIDRDNWICTRTINQTLDGVFIERFFYIPNDWITAFNLTVLTISSHGTLLIPLNGELYSANKRNIVTRYPDGFVILNEQNNYTTLYNVTIVGITTQRVFFNYNLKGDPTMSPEGLQQQDAPDSALAADYSVRGLRLQLFILGMFWQKFSSARSNLKSHALGVFRATEAIAWTSIFPYVYFMIESFAEVKQAGIPVYAGLLITVFTFCEFISGIIWARISDRIGRKATLVIGTFCGIFATVSFGLSRSMTAAVLSRALGGLANPNVGVVQTCIGELVRERKQQGISMHDFPL
ncbi:predicted protein [Uncinocarpus reesii 1704]|uniref:Major facilitator superfamily (MFS) profile domain-containing protein n=1 Tax=Uncinocarpus reesii (strain UAMH 1704) TaxID=336963 RepID=C4JYY5_UNCRE|nr:uncharacterized protein UREG_07386 [Uncinocarpus reesii 1704]EEP82521.1 predicted protein [Uncinocarpus reesii 1704]